MNTCTWCESYWRLRKARVHVVERSVTPPWLEVSLVIESVSDKKWKWMNYLFIIFSTIIIVQLVMLVAMEEKKCENIASPRQHHWTPTPYGRVVGDLEEL
jgi:hypothetical protein